MERQSKRTPLILVVCGLGAALSLLGFSSLSGRSPTDPLFERAVGELKRRSLPPGFHQGVALTAPYRRLTSSGTVDLVRTADGRLVVLFKTSVGWKGNYSGVMVSDAPLEPGEVGPDEYNRPSIRIRGLESVIRRKVDDRRYEVDFDLG